MISLVEALGYRCLKYVRQPLGPFHVLVGPNASGKTTFLDVIGFLSQFVSEGLDAAIESRTNDFRDLVWGRKDVTFELAIESSIPEELRPLLENKVADTVRYELALGPEPTTGEIQILSENGLLKQSVENLQQRLRFPEPLDSPDHIVTKKTSKAYRRLFTKTPGGNDNYYADAREQSGHWAPAFKLGPRKSTLGNLPEDESNFPVSTWFKQFLSDGVEKVVLESSEIRLASRPGLPSTFRPDGSNLPWVVNALQKGFPDRAAAWIEHVRTGLPELTGVDTREREDDRHRYLVLKYQGGLEVPSWMASDGSLRLLALTLPAYLQGLKGIYLIEEPENGIHPKAVETMFQSLSSVYHSQILMASHSPVVLSSAEPKQVLCFAKNSEGATDIVTGDNHPRLKDWRGEVDLGVLFAAGVLG